MSPALLPAHLSDERRDVETLGQCTELCKCWTLLWCFTQSTPVGHLRGVGVGEGGWWGVKLSGHRGEAAGSQVGQ